MKALVCGGRHFDQWRLLSSTLKARHEMFPITLVITGGASGADQLAQRWAEHERIPVAVYPANWRFAGKAAGPIRNRAMLDFGQPDVVIAFPGGRGTEDMVQEALRRRLAVLVVAPEDASQPSVNLTGTCEQTKSA